MIILLTTAHLTVMVIGAEQPRLMNAAYVVVVVQVVLLGLYLLLLAVKIRFPYPGN